MWEISDTKCELFQLNPYKKIYEDNSYGKAVKKISDKEKQKKYPERYPMNSDSIGIEVVARCLYSSNQGRIATWEPPTNMQRLSIQTLVKILQKEFNLNDEDLYQHQYIAYKTHGEGYGLYHPADINSNVDPRL